MAYIGQSLTEGVRRVTRYTVKSGQTLFPVSYTIGQIDVFVNGILLQPADFTASNGISVTITGLSVNDEVTLVSHNTFSVNSVSSQLTVGTRTKVVPVIISTSNKITVTTRSGSVQVGVA